MTPINFDSGGGNKRIQLSLEDCEGGGTIGLVSYPSSWLTASLDQSTNILTVNCDPTTSTLGNSGEIVLSFNGKTCTNNTMQVTQSGPNCGCRNFSLSTSSVSWPYNSKSATTVTYPEKGGCITEITATSDKEHFTVVTHQTNGITITPRDTNPMANPINATITVTYKANGVTCDDVKTISASHGGSNCGCGNFSFDTTELVWSKDESGESTAQTKTYTEKGGCITEITAQSNDNHFKVGDDTTDGIKVWPDDTNPDDNPKTATITVKYKANGVTCDTKTFSVKQNGSGCNCGSDLWLSPSSLSWAASSFGSSATSTVTYDFNSSCIDASNINVTNDSESDFTMDWQPSNKKILVYPKKENTSRTSPINGSITVTFNREGCDANKTISLTQLKSDLCDNCGLIDTMTKQTGYVGDNVFVYPESVSSYTFATGTTSAGGTPCGRFHIGSSSQKCTWTIQDIYSVYAGFKFNVSFNSAASSASSLRLYFKYTDGRADCYRDFQFIQNSCNCFDLRKVSWSVAFTNSKIPGTKLEDVPILRTSKNNFDSSCAKFVPPSNSQLPSWIKDLTFDDTSSSSYYYIRGNVSANTIIERSTTLKLTPQIRVQYGSTDKWYNCDTVDKEVTQEVNNCSCGEPATITKVIAGSADTYVFRGGLSGGKYYDKNCFNHPDDPSTFFKFEITDPTKTWVTLGTTTYAQDSGLYCSYNYFSAEENPSSTTERSLVVKITADLTSNTETNKCETLLTIKQEKKPNVEETCAEATNNINTYGDRPYDAGRYAIVYYSGHDSRYRLEWVPKSTDPTWITSISNTDRLGNDDATHLYGTYTANTGATELYKTDRRPATITVRVKRDGETCAETQVDVSQKGWSGSCACEGEIIWTQNTNGATGVDPCGTLKTASGKSYHAYDYIDTTTPQVLAYFNLTGSNECDIVAPITNQSTYFIGSLSAVTSAVTIGNVQYTHCVKGVIRKYSGDMDTPVSVRLILRRNIGGTNYEDCGSEKEKTFEILINTDKT